MPEYGGGVASMTCLLGIDIGGTKSTASVGTDDGIVLGHRVIPTKGSPGEVLEKLVSLAQDLIEKKGEVDAVGVVCGGPLDAEKGVILSPPNLPDWDAIPVVELFKKHFGLPTKLMNDANAGALAEWRHGAGRGSRNMMFCTMGTGFGCGLVLDGKLYEGANGNAGEIGHIRLTDKGPIGYGKAGSVEGWCSGGGIAELARMRLDESKSEGGQSSLRDSTELTAQTVAEAANSGNEAALAIYREVGERLGMALAMAIDLLNVEVIVLGSIFVRQEGLIRPAMESVLKREALPGALEVCRVAPASLGETIGNVAALSVAQLAKEVV
jgi:glucokinase